MFENPVHTVECIKGQENITYATFRMRDPSHYTVAWTKFSFHKDSFSSGLGVAKPHGPNLPIEIIDSTLSRGQPPATGIVGYG